ncbi:MAG: hypothetical protein J6Z38_08745, partial [Lachnospiraceae bacterium]|nr:hypothetical protein [Lachnospiraceae bacterium]
MSERKPKVWSIAVLTAVTVAAGLILVLTKTDALYSFLLADVYFLAVIVLLVRAFFKQLRYNIYSYNTIIYSGFALLFVFVLVACVFRTVQAAQNPGVYQPEQTAFILLGIPQGFMLITSPFVLIFAAALCVSNISLIRHEGKRLVNVLG